MANNAQKQPFIRTMNVFAERKVLDAIYQLGKGLPAAIVAVAGSIVTVKFDVNSPYTIPNVTLPMFGPEYIRYPMQVGDKGVVIPFDVRIGGITGLGAGTASLSLPANLSSIVFMPVANKNWDAPIDPNKIELYGPDGAILRNGDNSRNLILDAGGNTMLGDFTITGNLTVTGDTSLGGGTKKVVLDGDPVVGGGGGTVQASSTKTKAT